MSFAYDTSSWNKYAILVTLSWGATNIVRYTGYTVDLTLAGETYLSIPTLEVESSAPQMGGVKETPFTLRMIAVAPLDALISVYPHADVFCTIQECDPSISDGSQMRTIYFGKIGKVTKNKSGSKRLVQCEIDGVKALLQYPTGLSAEPRCQWAVGDINCCLDLGPFTQTAHVDSVAANTMVLSGFTTPGGDLSYWNFGEASQDGLIMVIRSFTGTTFVMKEFPPPSWVGTDITIIPGCDKFPGTCDNRFNNLVRISAYGVAIPAYHPEIQLRAR